TTRAADLVALRACIPAPAGPPVGSRAGIQSLQHSSQHPVSSPLNGYAGSFPFNTYFRVQIESSHAIRNHNLDTCCHNRSHLPLCVSGQLVDEPADPLAAA